MKKAFLVGMACLFLGACGSNRSSNQGGSPRASNASERDSVDDSGCHTAGSPFGGGSGTEADPYLICTPIQLQTMANSFGQSYFALTSDIDLANEKHEYLGIAIVGVLDGRNHAIKNFKVNAEMGQQHIGFLFGQLSTMGGFVAEIKNLRLENFRIEGSELLNAATLVSTNNRGKITNVHAAGSISGKRTIGGLVAKNNGMIRDSSFSGTLRGTEVIGGITGTTSEFPIENCTVSGEVSGDSIVGGVAGESDGTTRFQGNRMEAEVLGHSLFDKIVGKKPNGSSF